MKYSRLRGVRPWQLAAVLVIAVTGAACEPVPPTTTTPPTTTIPTLPPIPTPQLATVKCASGRTITVAKSIQPKLQAMVTASNKAKINLCGGGYRDQAGQIAARKRNCGTTHYDIYQKPAKLCKPPTAIPGTSMHEKGLAIDFTDCSVRTTNCFKWLDKNAATYGFKNLPSEPWHWSTNGH